MSDSRTRIGNIPEMMSLEHLIVPKIKEMIRQKRKIKYLMGVYQRSIGVNSTPSGQSWDSMSNKINEVVLDYPKRKVNVHDSKLI